MVGAILQVIQGTTGTDVTISSNIRTDTGLTATITPKLSSSKILILANIEGVYIDHTNVNNRINFWLMRGASDIGNIYGAFMYSPGLASHIRLSKSFNYLDSPATASPVTYKVQFANAENSGVVSVQRDSNSGLSTITLMEVAV